MERIQSGVLSLEVNPGLGLFDIRTANPHFPWLEEIKPGCEYTLDGKKFRSPGLSWKVQDSQHRALSTLEHGGMDCLVYGLAEDENKIGLTLTFGITGEHPMVMWKIKVTNYSNNAVDMNRIIMLDVDGRRKSKARRLKFGSPSDLGFFSNGWQSWSPSRWYNGEERMTISHLFGIQRPMIYNPGTTLPQKRGTFSSDMFAVVGDRVTRTGYLVGFLSQKNHFGSILADLNSGDISMWANGDHTRLDPGKEMETDWAVFTPVLLDHRAPLEIYIEAVGRENHARVPAETPVGWCSWYHFYTAVTADNIRENLGAILDQQEKLPIELVQIDDGFEKQVGDWLEFKPAFPHGVKPLAESISRAGLVPGLWLAPFIVHPGSDLAKNHPDWMLRKADGRLVNAGLGWKALTTALDLTVPEALQYAKDVISTASKEWGFPYLKLDFLYAAALNGRYHDRSLTRAQVMRMGMEALRQAAGPEVTLLGCGAPLGSAIGVVDAMRIGPDVSGDWLPAFNGIGAGLRKEPAVPSARNSIHNILTRANLNRGWWVNDPDCLLIRPDTNLTEGEVRSLATVIALTGGSLLLSDDLPGLPPDRLRIAEALLPVINEEVRVLDWFDNRMPSKLRVDMFNETGAWHLLGGFNWSEQRAALHFDPKTYHLEDGEYVFREFWSGVTGRFSGQTAQEIQDVPPHAPVLLAARRVLKGQAQYLGSDLHFSQGIEVVEWREDARSLEFTLRLPRIASGVVILSLPFTPVNAVVNGEQAAIRMLTEGIYNLPVSVEGFCKVRINKEGAE
ncbi:MAG TPA: alpha-galactosidase [Anaerolineaceae bacterium]|nr:alpha-galactosidase [Anaerolineaceae bacterium]